MAALEEYLQGAEPVYGGEDEANAAAEELVTIRRMVAKAREKMRGV